MNVITLSNIVLHSTTIFGISLVATITTVMGCGTMPPGQEKNVTFTATGFTLPVPMVYTEMPNVAVILPVIATSEARAKAYVQRLMMHTVYDVIESQSRAALLPDGVISTILDQLSVEITYKPMNCNRVVSPEETPAKTMEAYCVIVGNTVTGICTTKKRQSVMIQIHQK